LSKQLSKQEEEKINDLGMIDPSMIQKFSPKIFQDIFAPKTIKTEDFAEKLSLKVCSPSFYFCLFYFYFITGK
jgi:hypothetical protein